MIFTQRLFTMLLGLLFATVLSDQASALYDPGVGRFCSRDPIGYADGSHLYSFLLEDLLSSLDPRGLSRCQLNGAPRVRIPECRLIIFNGIETIGFKLTIDLDFRKPEECCKCCSYRQYLLLKTVKIERRENDGSWQDIDQMLLPDDYHTYPGPGKEDCKVHPVTGEMECFGHRGKDIEGASEYSNGGCNFKAIDTPNLPPLELRKELIKAAPHLLPGTFRISVFRRFLLSVIDECDHGTSIWSRAIDTNCTNFETFLDKPFGT